jgi:Protease inhibitor Inh
MRIAATIAIVVLLIGAGVPARAQQPAPSDAAKAMVGTWELSNADRDRTCNITFKLGTAPGGYPIDLDKGCGEAFPAIRAVVAWTIGKNDMLLLVDGKGASQLELLEVEAGMFEGLRPNEGRYFLQNASLAAAQKDKTADQMFGDWTFVRGNGSRSICGVTLQNTAKDADSFALSIKTVCDPVILRFGPVAWKMDRGQLILVSGKGELWRFEEADSTSVPTWRRVPEGRQPLSLMKQQ